MDSISLATNIEQSIQANKFYGPIFYVEVTNKHNNKFKIPCSNEEIAKKLEGGIKNLGIGTSIKLNI